MRTTFTVIEEPAGGLDLLLGLVCERQPGGKGIHDANIVATMIANGIPAILTNNAKHFDAYADRIVVMTLDSF